MKKRLSFQLLFLLFGSAIMTFVIVSGKKSIHNICPNAIICFGILKGNIITLSLGLTSLGIFLGILFMIVAMYWGRVFCGYVCPLGTIQELIFRVFHKRKNRQIPYFVERKLSKIKYWLMGISIVLVGSGFAWISINLCPIYALSRIPSLAPLGLFTLAVILIGGLFLERLWCRFLCPYAALLNIAQALGGLFGIKRKKIRRNLERCADCGVCSVNCPMNIDILGDEYVNALDCIHCQRCIEKCPKIGTITEEKEH